MNLLIGYKVSSTIRTGMIDVSLFQGEEKRLMLGYLSSLIGKSLFYVHSIDQTFSQLTQ